jgi:hypothetical protein
MRNPNGMSIEDAEVAMEEFKESVESKNQPCPFCGTTVRGWTMAKGFKEVSCSCGASAPMDVWNRPRKPSPAVRAFLELWPLDGYQLEAYCACTFVPAIRGEMKGNR